MCFLSYVKVAELVSQEEGPAEEEEGPAEEEEGLAEVEAGPAEVEEGPAHQISDVQVCIFLLHNPLYLYDILSLYFLS